MQFKSEAFLQHSAQTFARGHHDVWNGRGNFGMGHAEQRPAESGVDQEWL
jgi:hypothetical protein